MGKNMKNKKLLFLAITLIFISLGAASASEDIMQDNDLNLNAMNLDDATIDIDPQEVETQSNANQELQNIESQDESDTQETETEVTSNTTNSSPISSKTNPKTFEDIQNLIDKATAGSTIKLSGTYIGNSKEITINKALTIKGVDGKATLNAKGLSRIFNIKAKGVILENLNLINGKSDNGGAIYAKSRNSKTYCVKINKCVFKNNTAKRGGAIYSGANLKVTNSKFTSNTAKSGGAICCEDDDDINKDKLYINKCTFYKNKVLKQKSSGEYEVTYNYGGAVLTDFKKSYIYNSKFTSNSAKTKGGAISATRNLNCKNCKFYKNTAKSGAVIQVAPNIIDVEELINPSINNIQNCILSKNTAKNNLLFDCDSYRVKMNIKNLAINKYKYTITKQKSLYFNTKIINKKTKKAVKKAKIKLKIKYYDWRAIKHKTYQITKKTNKKGKAKFDMRPITQNSNNENFEFYLTLANSKKYFMKLT